ncbi:hypothetical protein [Dehalobacter sp.]|uniref:hypothetical protein n=1 Tax=Dehalobacter sp. TaxID=1962289 RepID=UPI00258FC14C|nr:hypothetical protein [Dehalobacter sp.]MDJ0305106.1 hypothetical protein [Dehalobacter sp.]
MNALATLKLLPQECKGSYRFNSPLYVTRGFQEHFKEDTFLLAMTAIQWVGEERVRSKNGADYLQVFEANGERFWLIDDVDHVTALLPEEY